MSNYVVNFKQTIKAEVEFETDVYPEEYLYCESEEEVRNEINLFMEENIDCGEYIITEINSSESEIPEEFFKEWRELKNDPTRGKADSPYDF